MQKKVLAIHDLSGFGRSSMVPIIGVLSAQGHQCVPALTAAFSTHTAIAGYVQRDLTADLAGWLAQYKALGLTFDAVYSGFLNSEAQIDRILWAAEHLRAPGGIILVDPVMGDGGKVYRTYTSKMCGRMGQLCMRAEIITPNVTEAAILLDKDPAERPKSVEEGLSWARALAARYSAKVVLTGLEGDADSVCVICAEEAGETCFSHARIAAYYPGTGDLFACTLLARLLSGAELISAAKTAAHFVHDCITYTAAQGTEPLYGVQFEPLLGSLLAHREA